MKCPALPLALLFLFAQCTSVLGCASAKTHCTLHSDCHVGSYCDNGVCRFDCRNDFDCATGHCQLQIGRCDTLPDGGVVHDLAGHPEPADLTMEGSPDLLPMPALLKYADLCHADGECASMLCSKNPFSTGDHECTGPCQSSLDCAVGDFCVKQGLNQCAQSDIGRNCAQAADCRGGACVTGGGAPSFCTVVCNSAAECPAGYSCSPIQGTRVCVNVEATGPCNNDGNCYYGTGCDAANGRCLGGCRGNADCPLWHQCQNIAGRLLCAPNQALGRGGNGDGCAGGNDCREGLCFKGTCADGCGVTSDTGQFCPGGFGCNPISTGNGNNTLICLPAGSGSPGDPCTGPQDCTSGLCVDMPGYCSRFCNSAPCPSPAPRCVSVGIKADGVALNVCSK